MISSCLWILLICCLFFLVHENNFLWIDYIYHLTDLQMYFLFEDPMSLYCIINLIFEILTIEFFSFSNLSMIILGFSHFEFDINTLGNIQEDLANIFKWFLIWCLYQHLVRDPFLNFFLANEFFAGILQLKSVYFPNSFFKNFQLLKNC